MNKQFSQFHQMLTNKFPPNDALKELGFLSTPIESSEIREHLGHEMHSIYPEVQRGGLWVFMLNELSTKKIETTQGSAAFMESNYCCAFILLDFFDKKNQTEQFLSVSRYFNNSNNSPEMNKAIHLWEIFFSTIKN